MLSAESREDLADALEAELNLLFADYAEEDLVKCQEAARSDPQSIWCSVMPSGAATSRQALESKGFVRRKGDQAAQDIPSFFDS